MTDRRVLYGTAFVRALATGMLAVLLGEYLAGLALSRSQIGLVVAAGLVGAGLATLAATMVADRMGRRQFLVLLTMVSALGAAALSFVRSPWLLGGAALVGMVNGMGRDRGAALVLEQAMLPSTTSAAQRTRVFAWYNVLQDSGRAVGALLAGTVRPIVRAGVSPLGAHRALVGGYVVLFLVLAVGYSVLSPAVDAEVVPRVPVSPATRRILGRLSALFALDSLGSGFVATSLLTLFFASRFHVDAATLGPLFAAASVANALSHLGAAWLAVRIGLVNTMVWTHIPSSLLLVTVAFAPSFGVAAALLLARESLVEMDVPTRQSYVMAVVRPGERTFASGVTHLVRMAGWAVAAGLTGVLMDRAALIVPLVVSAALKISYDVLLWLSFRKLRPPEETAAGMPPR